MKVHKKIIFVILSLVIFFTFSLDCVYGAGDYWSQLPDNIKAKIKKSRRFSSKLSNEERLEEFKKILYNYKDFEDEIPPEQITYKGTRVLPVIKKEKAIADVNFLFKLLKYGYAGYQYFGGDARFLRARKQILDDIKENQLLFSYLTVKSFNSILYHNLNFIQDGHFTIANYQLVEDKYFYINRNYLFHQGRDGYYTELKGEKKYLESINGEDPAGFLKLTLNNEGKIVYCPGAIVGENNNSPQFKLTFKNGEKKIFKQINLKKITHRRLKGKKAFNIKTIAGIPVIESRSMAPDSKEHKSQLQEFADSGSKLKNEEFIIIDLRGNSGGSEIYPQKWVENYTGEKPASDQISCDLATETAVKMLKNSLKYSYGDYNELFKKYPEMKQICDDGWAEIDYGKPKQIDNNSLIIVLIDNNVGSAGESFINYLRDLKNVIIMGTNTGGCSAFGNLGFCRLPHSRTRILMGKTLFFPLDLKLREGRGFMPDIWVDPDEFPDLAVKFINYYW